MLIHEFMLPPRDAHWLDYDFNLEHHAACYSEQRGVYEPHLRKWRPFGVSLVITRSLMIHTDSHEMPRYAYHAILHNDGFIAKGPKQSLGQTRTQLVGGVVCLDIWQPHHVTRDRRVVHTLEADYPIWASLCFNVTEPLPDADVIARFNHTITQLQLPHQ